MKIYIRNEINRKMLKSVIIIKRVEVYVLKGEYK